MYVRHSVYVGLTYWYLDGASLPTFASRGSPVYFDVRRGDRTISTEVPFYLMCSLCHPARFDAEKKRKCKTAHSARLAYIRCAVRRHKMAGAAVEPCTGSREVKTTELD
jgi:hypothetical protein